MNKINNGGPAFPVTPENEARMNGSGGKGISARDYFAAKADISKDLEDDGCIAERLALNLMDGSPMPAWDSDYLAARIWWAEAEARLRYMKADAMLKARQA
jgi:hypothetical protein